MIKDPHSVRSPAGLEWWLLKRLHLITLAGLLVFALVWLLIERWPWSGSADQVQAAVTQAEFALIGAVIFFFTMVVTVLVGCVVVMIMKGPAYTSPDSYYVEDSERPDSSRP
jgi:hypothetical protein